MQGMVKRLGELSPPSEGVPPIAYHLHSLGINATAPEAVNSIAEPPFHNMEAAPQDSGPASFRHLPAPPPHRPRQHG